jgi:hypothetical protein
VEQAQDGLLELGQGGSRGHDAAAQPKSNAQTEAPAVRNYHEFLDLVDETFAALAVAVESEVDLLNVSPD